MNEETSRAGSDASDPVTFSVILNRFHSIVNEMTAVLQQTAWSSLLALARDFSAAIYDAGPRQISMAEGLPIHTASMHLVLAEIGKTVDGELNPEDVFICNDPYRFNTHIGDLIVASPVFVDGEHRFWSVVRGHQIDVGAFVPASTTSQSRDVYQEGLTIPPLRIHEAGKPRRDVIELYLSNLRYRNQVEGDLMAQVGAVRRGTERLAELCAEYGPEVIDAYVERILDYTSRRTEQEIEAMPDGEYRASGWVDSDGVDQFDVPIEVRVAISGSEIEVDFTGTGPQGTGGVNGTYATAQAAGTLPFLYYMDPSVPHNDGSMRHIDVYVPEGTIGNARHPASTSCATATPTDMMQDTVNRAMAAAVPDRVPAGGCRNCNVFMAGIDERDGEPWGAMLVNNGGGSGASPSCDGWPLMSTIAAWGGLTALPIEQLELLYPFRIREMELEPDSMGLGRRIGGPGTRLVVEPLAGPIQVSTVGDGALNPPHGVLGSTPGIGGGHYAEDAALDKRRFFSATADFTVAASEVWVGVSSGGGGYGDPLDRDLEQVRVDVRDGVISKAAAREVFGLVLDDGFDPAIDEEATREARAELSAAPRRGIVEPTGPRASRWLERTMSPQDEYISNPRHG